MAVFIQLEHVTKIYRGAGSEAVRALDDVTFDIEQGEWIAIMGPSGSGKTTLLNLLGCLDQPTSGSVRIGATDTAKLSRSALARFRAETVGFVFQQFHLIPHLTALENVMLAQYFHSMSDEGEAQRALERVGLSDRATHLPSQLSGGEQQRVAIARALVNDPKIILADEPTGNLDADNQHIVLQLLSELHIQGRTILMVTHDEHVGRYADRRIDLEHGRVAEAKKQFSAEENRDFDEVLEQLWTARERQGHRESARFDEAKYRRLVNTMKRIGLVESKDGAIVFTPGGEERASALIRRHRLAERLFVDVLSIGDWGAIESNACTFEHVLSEEVTDRICTFLGHPATCPHGCSIPNGECCLQKRTLKNPAELSGVLSGLRTI